MVLEDLMSILLSNDDGIHAPGLRALYEGIKDLEEVFIVAPDREQSATSHSLTLHRPLRIHKHDQNEFSVDGTPTDCMLLAINKILPKKPRLIISGINHGANLGDDVTYSGTVSAALEGAIMGIPSIAVSLVGIQKFNFNLATKFVKSLAKKVLEKGLPKGVYLNVNVPGDLVDFTENKDIPYAITHIGKRDYGSVVVEKSDPRGREYVWIGGDPKGFLKIPGSDCNAILNHLISITPLQVDITHYQFLEELRHWELDDFRHSPSKTD